MNYIHNIVDELLLIKHRNKTKNIEIKKGLNISLYRITNVFSGTGRIDDLAKIYDFLKEIEAQNK